MDFELSEEYRSFQDMVRRWVDKEAPKDWARALEKDEHNYPYALWDKFTEAAPTTLPASWSSSARARVLMLQAQKSG